MINIKIERIRKGITQQQLADKLELSRVTVSSYEQGSRIAPVDILIKIADIFDVSIDYLVGRSDK